MRLRGFSLIETVLYIGLLAVLMPTFVIVTLGYIQKSDIVNPRIRMEENAATLFSELHSQLTQAQSIVVTVSSLGSDDSSFVFVDVNGATVTMSRVTDTVTFVGGDQDVERLAWITASGSEWITDADMSVDAWNVSVVRDEDGILTGVNFLITVSVLNPDGSPFRDISFSSDTTVQLQPYIVEL